MLPISRPKLFSINARKTTGPDYRNRGEYTSTWAAANKKIVVVVRSEQYGVVELPPERSGASAEAQLQARPNILGGWRW